MKPTTIMSKRTVTICDICKNPINKDELHSSLSIETVNNIDPSCNYGMEVVTNKQAAFNPRYILQDLCTTCTKNVLYGIQNIVDQTIKMNG